MSHQVRHDDDNVSDQGLRALVRVSAAVAGALSLDAVLAVAAEQSLRALGCSTVSISRWDRSAGSLQTLINVGDLAASEERLPPAEHYLLSDFPLAYALLNRGEAHITNADDPAADCDPNEIALLAALGKSSCLAVPIRHEGRTWGELYAAVALGQPRRFYDADVSFLGAVAAQLAVAIERAEIFLRIQRFAYEDPLTGLANRRALEEQMDAAITRALDTGGDVALVLSDLDALKQTNDTLGHEAGDRHLLTTADALRQVAAARPHTLAARIGGDEFCLLLQDADVHDGQRAARDLAQRLAATGTALTVSSGVSSMCLGPRRAADLLRLADAAQYRAKRKGPGRICTATDLSPAPVSRSQLQRPAVAPTGSLERLLSDTLELLDTVIVTAPPLERIAAVADACAHANGVTRWAISRVRPGTAHLETLMHAKPDHAQARTYRLQGDQYALADYPATERLMENGGVLIAAVDDPNCDPAERALLLKRGHTQLLAVATKHAQTTTLVELFADAPAPSLHRLAPVLRVLLAEAARDSPPRP